MIGQDNQDKDYISEINVTPLVDVVLVLLVIFMISAPLLMNHIALELPKTKKVQKLSQTNSNITISINNTGEYFLDKNPITFERLEKFLKAKNTTKSTTTVFLRADEKTDYSFVAKTLALLKTLNINQISLVTEIEKN